MYKTFIQSNFLYAIEVWGHSLTTQSDILVQLQNKVMRVVFNCKRTLDAWKHSGDRILSIQDLYIKTISRICTKHHYNQLPNYFSTYIMPTKQSNTCVLLQNDHKLRSRKHLLVNYHEDTSSSIFQKSCSQIWNKLPLLTKQAPYQK